MEPPPDAELVGALLRRVRHAVAEAEKAVGRSRRLTAARRLLHEPGTLLKRCAWCGRVSFGSRWEAIDELPGFVPQRVREDATHTICPDCVRRLERQGKSRTASAAEDV